MITCKSPTAKRILADHLKETESPGISVLDLAAAFAKERNEPIESLSYEGPQQDKLKAKLTAMRNTKAEAALNEARKKLT